MVVCDLEGYKVDGPAGVAQCREVKMHSCIYRLRQDVQAIVHVHPPFTVLMSLLRVRIRPMCNEGAQLVRNPLPVYPDWKTVWTEEEGAEVARTLGDAKAIIFHGHGATTVGRSLEQAVMGMWGLEEQAKMNWHAYCAVGSDYPSISDDLMDEKFNRSDISELPHFKGVWPKERSVTVGVYAYYAELVATDL